MKVCSANCLKCNETFNVYYRGKRKVMVFLNDCKKHKGLISEQKRKKIKVKIKKARKIVKTNVISGNARQRRTQRRKEISCH